MKGIQVCSNKGPRPFSIEDNYETVKNTLPKFFISYNVLPASPRPVRARRLFRVSGKDSGLSIDLKWIL